MQLVNVRPGLPRSLRVEASLGSHEDVRLEPMPPLPEHELIDGRTAHLEGPEHVEDPPDVAQRTMLARSGRHYVGTMAGRLRDDAFSESWYGEAGDAQRGRSCAA